MEEKISEKLPEKIDTIVSTKDEKKVNDKNEEGLSQIEKLVVKIAKRHWEFRDSWETQIIKSYLRRLKCRTLMPTRFVKLL